MAIDAPVSRVLALVFTDLADSTALKTARGDAVVRELITRHRTHVSRLAAECSGRIVDWAGDGCFLTFETSSAATMFALRLQQVHAEETDLPGVRVGVHLGEISESVGPDGTPRIEGLAVDIAARVSGLAKPSQILMSSAVYDSARQRLGVDTLGVPILWQAHGTYQLKGFDKAFEIGEAGLEGVAPMKAPKTGEKAKRTRRKPGTSFGNESLTEVTTQFRLYGRVLVGVSIVILYVGLQFDLMLKVLGFVSATACSGLTAMIISKRTFKLYRKEKNADRFYRRVRSTGRRALELGMILILLGALISTLSNGMTFYVLAMVSIPFCAIGITQLYFLRRIRRTNSPQK